MEGNNGRLHIDDANNASSYSPSHTPPLLQQHNLSGNDSSSGSPSGSRRHGSTGEKEKKNREERLRLIKERQEQEHEKRLAELKAANEKEMKIRQTKDAERLRRIQEIKMKESQRRLAVEERRRKLETEDKEKREQILAKYKEYQQKLIGQRDLKKPVYAFGSSTPRTLAYLEHLDNSMRVYNSRMPPPPNLPSGGAGGGQDEEASSAKSSTSPDKRATSACSLTRKALTASSSPNLISPLHHQHNQHRTRVTSGTYHHQQNLRHHPPPSTTTTRRDIVLAPSGRWGGSSMVASMYGGSAALSSATASRSTAHGGADHRADPLAGARGMTTSFAVGESSVAPRVNNVRAKGGALSGPASTRKIQSGGSATARLAQQSNNNNNSSGAQTTRTTRARQKESQSSQQQNGGDNGAASAAETRKHTAKGVSSTRTPSAPPPSARRPYAGPEAKPKQATTTTAKGVAGQKPPSGKAETAEVPPKIIRKPNNKSTTTPNSESSSAGPASGKTSPNVLSSTHRNNGSEDLNMNTTKVLESGEQLLNLERGDNLREYGDNPTDQISMVDNGEELVIRVESTSPTPPVIERGSPVPQQQEIVTGSGLMTESTVIMSMSQSTTDLATATSVPKPTGQSGKVLSKEEATAALAERRRMAREQMEREKELERQREEQKRLEEEEARRAEEEEFRRQEAEELRILEEARRLEEERIRKFAEEEEKRREEEAKQREEEQQKKLEAEARAREEAERGERERKEAEEKFKKDEQERLDRKKRLEAIMQRTRQTGGANSTPNQSSAGKPDNQQDMMNTTPASFVVNGNNDLSSSRIINNESIYVTPDASMNSSAYIQNQQQPSSISSNSLLKKIASARPEVGRSLENIFNNRANNKSSPNVSSPDEPTGGAGSAVLMTTLLSADKVAETMTTPIAATGGQARLTQSFYATPIAGGGGDNSFNLTSGNGGGVDSSESEVGRTEYDLDPQAIKSQSGYATRVIRLENEEEDEWSSSAGQNGGGGGTAAASVSILGLDQMDSNANRPPSSEVNGQQQLELERSTDGSGSGVTSSIVYGNGRAVVESSSTTATSASDSDGSSAVTVIHQMSPRDLSTDDLLSSPNKVGSARLMEDLVNDNISNSSIQSHNHHQQERPLMEF